LNKNIRQKNLSKIEPIFTSKTVKITGRFKEASYFMFYLYYMSGPSLLGLEPQARFPMPPPPFHIPNHRAKKKFGILVYFF
jgi:hypothetical protein